MQSKNRLAGSDEQDGAFLDCSIHNTYSYNYSHPHTALGTLLAGWVMKAVLAAGVICRAPHSGTPMG